MTLVEEALRHPEDEREGYLRRACHANSRLFNEAWSYVQWEKRMQRFLLDPLQPPAESKLPFQPGQILINRFRIVREVAQGGMGIVWEAIDQKLDRRVALKCAKAGFGTHLPPEVRNAREISHPNVCKIFEIHTASTPDGEIDFISMEFLEGETLAERVNHVRLPESKARAIAQQLSAGLAEAHRNHLIHGDLKTNNVILATDSAGSTRAVITDFGLARNADASAALLGGTPAYMAPELWRGAKPSVVSDIYALGVILWELHYGQPPSDLGMVSSTLPAGEHLSWKPPVGHGRWDRIIARCLDPEPARRFQSAQEVAQAFRPSRLRKRLQSAVALLLLAAGSGWITYQSTTGPAEKVHLALLPDNGSFSGVLLRDTANRLAELKSSPQTRFRFISLDKVIRNHVHTPDEARVLVGASHALRATAERQGDAVTVHAYLADLRSGVDAREWTAEYKASEMRYVPTALAGVVTETLHLPPTSGGASVNAAAQQDYQAGLSALRRDRTVDQARRSFEQAVKSDRDSALTWAGLAEAQRLTGGITGNKDWLDCAVESVQQAQKRNLDLPEVHRIAGLVQASSGHYDQAIVEYRRAIELDPANDDAYRRMGEAYEDNNQVDEALTAFQKAIKSGPQQFRNFRDLGGLYYEQASYNEAIFYLRRAVELAPREPQTLYGLGVAHLANGQFASAENELRSSLRLSDAPDTANSLAVVQMYQGKDRAAVSYLKRVLDLGRDRYLAWMNLGTAYRHLGFKSESRRAYRHGLVVAEADIANNPRSGRTRAYLAYLCAQVGERRRAESEIIQALQQSPSDGATVSTVALTYEALHRRNDTLEVLTTASRGTLANLARWPDVADLHRDPRFIKLLASHGDK